MNLNAIRTALKTALTGHGYTAYDVLPANAELPAVVVGFPTLEYHQTGDDGTLITCPVTIAVELADFEQAQRDLSTALDPTELPAVIEAHATEAWDQAVVRTADNWRGLVDPQALAVDLTVDLIAP